MSTVQPQSHVYKFGISMPCGGCSGAVKRVLEKFEGLESFDVSIDNQTATVHTKDDTVSYDSVLKAIHKTGKTITSGEANGKSMSIEVPAES